MNDLPRPYCLDCVEGCWTTRAVIVPSLGANVIGFSFQHADWQFPVHCIEPVDLCTFFSNPTSFGMPLLGPTPGRVGRSQSGDFWFEERQYRVKRRRHGFFRQWSWEVAKDSAQSVTCRLVVDKVVAEEFGTFPFLFDVDYSVTVRDRVLQCQLKVQSTSSQPQPLGVGWHPYLHSLQAPVVTIPARSYWKLYDEPEATPNGDLGRTEEKADFRNGRKIELGEHFDDVFTDLVSAVGESMASANTIESATIIRKGERENVAIRRTVALAQKGKDKNFAPLRHVQLYTPPDRDAICLEPLSCPPDAINLGIDDLVLGPGEHRTFAMALAIDLN